MRSINNNMFAKVEGHDSLIRDMSSHAILSTSDIEYQSYKRSRDASKRQHLIMQNQSKEIESLKNDLDEIKQLLNQVLKGK